jgi:hypothetical protein
MIEPARPDEVADMVDRGGGPAQERSETRGLAAQQAPADPEQQEREHDIAEQRVGLDRSAFACPPAAGDGEHQAPVEEARRKVPDQGHARRRLVHGRRIVQSGGAW